MNVTTVHVKACTQFADTFSKSGWILLCWGRDIDDDDTVENDFDYWTGMRVTKCTACKNLMIKTIVIAVWFMALNIFPKPDY